MSNNTLFSAFFTMATAAVLCFLPASASAKTEADLVIYGGNSAAVTAAVQAARQQKSVVLISPDKRLGGLTSGGLGWTDVGTPKIVGGLSREFYHRIWRFYTDPAAWKSTSRAEFLKAKGQHVQAIEEENQVMWLLEPSAAERVFNEMIAEAGVKVIRGRLDLANGVVKNGARIVSIRTEDGQEIAGRYFIDATYEGDLMAKAGVSYTVGREANSVFGETISGVQAALSRGHNFPPGIDPYRVKGDPGSGLLPGVNPNAGGPDGTGDKKVQAYCFRMVLTDVPENRVRIEKPPGYDELEYEMLFRVIEAGRVKFFNLDMMPNRKTDSNNSGPVSTDFIGKNYDYPDADYATRERIIKDHENWQRGLVWTLQNHPRVPESIRTNLAPWGLPKDEFVDNGHWPTQLYVREARRMIGEMVETENTLRDAQMPKLSIGMGAYTMDSHNVQRYVNANGELRNEGDVQIDVPGPYPIDYRAIVPKAAECENLLVPVCLSASHTAYGSIRMEPVFMTLGQSAAAAACLALEKNQPVQKIDYMKLREQLLKLGQVLELKSND